MAIQRQFTLFLALVAATTLTASAQTWSYCSGEQYAFEIDSVDIEPYPIERGASTSFTLSGVSSITVNQANIDLKIKKGFITIFHTNLNLCDYYTCPIPEGTVDVSLPETVPSEVPKGKYKYSIDITDPQYTGTVVCVEGEFQVV